MSFQYKEEPVFYICKVWLNPNSFAKFKLEMEIFKLSQSSADLLVKKCNEEIWQDRVSARDYNKELKTQKIHLTVLKGAFAKSEAPSNLINLKKENQIPY